MNAAAHTVLLPLFLVAVAAIEMHQVYKTVVDWRYSDPSERGGLVRQFFIHVTLTLGAWSLLCAR